MPSSAASISLLVLVLLSALCLLVLNKDSLPQLTQMSNSSRISTVLASHHYHSDDKHLKCGNVSYPGEDTRRFYSLPSGWDSSGLDLYEKERTKLATSLVRDAQAVHSHRVLPLDAVKTTGNTWFGAQLGIGGGPPKWEVSTFINFFKHLSGCKYYVGFGTWIGPTLFYAAQLVDEAYGIEADPVAFAQVETNLALNKNSAWASHTHLNHHAVGMGAEDKNATPTIASMSSASAGNSCSGLGKVACGKASVFWKVNAYPLPYLLKLWNVPVTNQLFIKVDVESFECQLVPSWLPWLQSIEGKKPIFHIALHSQIVQCSQDEYRQIYLFGSLFDFKHDACMDKDKGEWIGNGCRSGEFIFYDAP